MKNIHVAVGIIEDAERGVLIALRQGNQHLAGLWEFPGGKVDAGEDAGQALSRELNEELGIKIKRPEFLFSVEHEYPEKSVTLHIFHVREVEGEAEGKEGQEIRWVKRQDLTLYTFPEANIPIMDYLSQV